MFEMEVPVCRISSPRRSNVDVASEVWRGGRLSPEDARGEAEIGSRSAENRELMREAIRCIGLFCFLQ